MTRHPRPILACRIYPESRRGLFCTLCVFETLGEARRWVRWMSPHSARLGRFKGLSQTWYLIRGGRAHPCFGRIVLARRWCGTEVITHEIQHVVLAWARRKGLLSRVASETEAPGQLASGDEERICHAMGRMSAQVVNALYRGGLLK